MRDLRAPEGRRFMEDRMAMFTRDGREDIR